MFPASGIVAYYLFFVSDISPRSFRYVACFVSGILLLFSGVFPVSGVLFALFWLCFGYITCMFPVCFLL